MIFERIETPGLAHYSYWVGDREEAVVIDPRRDVDIYVDQAARAGFQITHVLETHRHEDFVSGARELSERTGARIWHADAQLAYGYGETAEDGQTWRVGGGFLQAILAPGHTPGMLSYLLYDSEGASWILFSGDALLAGGVGRVDLKGPERAEEMAGLLYETIFKRFMPLGDEIIVCPAHGPGSICAGTVAARTFTTLGIERRHNPMLLVAGRREFIAQAARIRELPPYFRRLERLNVEGPPRLGPLLLPKALGPDEFAEQAKTALVLDTRSGLEFTAGHIVRALSIWLEGLPRFAGWFLSAGQPVLLVCGPEGPAAAMRHLSRLGFDHVDGYLAGGMLAWHTAGYEKESVRMVSVSSLCKLLDAGEKAWILDVRSEDELASHGAISGAHHIHITMLPERMAEVPKDGTVYIFCASDLRSMIAASLLQRAGWRNMAVVLGGLIGWNSTTCPIV